jgi:hypothetical protein
LFSIIQIQHIKNVKIFGGTQKYFGGTQVEKHCPRVTVKNAKIVILKII